MSLLLLYSREPRRYPAPIVQVARAKAVGPTVAVTLPAAPSPGNVLVLIAVGSSFQGANGGLTPPAGATTLLAPVADNTNQIAAAYSLPVVSGTSATQTFTGVSAGEGIGLFAVEVALAAGSTAAFAVQHGAPAFAPVQATLAAADASAVLRLVAFEHDDVTEWPDADVPARAFRLADNNRATTGTNHTSALFAAPRTAGAFGFSAFNANAPIYLAVDVLVATHARVVSVVQVARNKAVGPNVSVVLPAAPAAGNAVLLIAAGSSYLGSNSGLTPPAGAVAAQAPVADADSQLVAAWYLPVAAGQSATCTFTGVDAGEGIGLFAVELAGAASFAPQHAAFPDPANSTRAAFAAAPAGASLRFVVFETDNTGDWLTADATAPLADNNTSRTGTNHPSALWSIPPAATNFGYSTGGNILPVWLAVDVVGAALAGAAALIWID